MSNANDFKIINGLLVQYVGAGGDVVIPADVTTIGNWAFFDCKSLTSVTIADSVTAIGGYAFNCVGLTSITIPETVTTIGDTAFLFCKKLTLYGKADSYAETYAKKNNIPFVAE